jgi:hypothetical protein
MAAKRKEGQERRGTAKVPDIKKRRSEIKMATV